MRLKPFKSLFLSSLVVLLVTFSARAEDNAPKANQNTFALEVINNLINLHAEEASFKEILNDLEKKTGIKVNIFEEVKDKKVTLNITTLPVYAILAGIFWCGVLKERNTKRFSLIDKRYLCYS